ncbi:hypothetical protein MBLNU459_g4993t2 [Dothideomycetes sp. NU459]
MSDPELLAESEIRSLALNGASLVPRQGSDIYLDIASVKLEKLADDLIFTLNYNDLIGSHRASACNLLFWSRGAWTQAFDVFLNQHHALNIKPSRQLMVSLTSVLMKCSDSTTVKNTKTATLNRLMKILVSTTEHVPIRPSLQALAHFSTKKFASIDDLYNAFCVADESALENTDPNAKLCGLLEATLRWAPFDDFSSSAGLFATIILQSHQHENQQATQHDLAFNTGRNAPWTKPILTLLTSDPSCLDNLRHYIFPEIFKRNTSDYISFLECLQVHDILRGTSKSVQHLDNFRMQPDQLEDVLFCALSVGSKLDMVQVVEAPLALQSSTQLFLSGSSLCIPDRLLGNLLLRSSSKVRIAALSMLISAVSSTKPLSVGSIDALKKGLPFLHADSDSGFRSEFFSLIKNLIDRLRGATSVLAKPPTRGGKAGAKAKATAEAVSSIENASALLGVHKAFLEWYLAFLKTELRPTASYQRHICAVKCIAFVYRSGVDTSVPIHLRSKSAGPQITWPFELSVVDRDLTDLLLDLLLDPFDDVRLGAADVLGLVGIGTQSATEQMKSSDLKMPRLVEVLSKAEQRMMLTGRADQADGVAHLYSIIFSRCARTEHGTEHDIEHSTGYDAKRDAHNWWESKVSIFDHLIATLEKTLDIAAIDISKAVSKHPLHGLFISIRYILEKNDFYSSLKTVRAQPLQALFLRLYECLRRTWSCVRSTLCNDAPEGFVPDDVEEEDDVGTKDILSYSWRALKEASLVLRTLVKTCPLTKSEYPLMTVNQLEEMGDLSFMQLAELRHRGAFSTVSQTFVACCLSCNSISGSKGSVLETWYKRAILCIQNQTTINTRRSAGLPSLMVGIIIADESNGVVFSQAMRDLTREAVRPVGKMVDQSGGLSQVHALNCLKDIFKNSKLGERSEPHVATALGLAANCLSSDTWAVRNSGLMLFRALLDRLLGTNDAYDGEETTHSRLSYAAVPNLMEVILSLLSSPTESSNEIVTEGVFPALQLLQRAQPPAEKLQHISKAVFELTSNSQWHIRDKAARTYAALVPRQGRVDEAVRLLGNIASSQNATHGVLLCSMHLLRKAALTRKELARISAVMANRMETFYHKNQCPFTRAAFVDLWTECAIEESKTLHKHSDFALANTFDAAAELDTILKLPQDVFASYSFLRQSLGKLLISEMPLSQNDDKNNIKVISTIIRLAERDPDACTTMLNEAKKLCSNNVLFKTLAHPILSDVCATMLFRSQALDLEVRAAAQEVILALLDSQQAEAVRGTLLIRTEELYISSDDATPLFQDQRLILQAALLEIRLCRNEDSDHSLTVDFEEWVAALGGALHEDSPFDSRLAAAQAACQIHQGIDSLLSSDAHRNGCFSYCLALYDLTNDDDDDVRNIAARAACKFLSVASPTAIYEDMIPLAAGAKLMGFLMQQLGLSSKLANTAIERLSGGNVTIAGVKGVREILTAHAREDTALFVQERQNLFIDGAREARLWSQALTRLDSAAFSSPMVANLTKWTMDGLDVLISAMNKNVDGPLGWTRRASTFLLGLQLICAAEVLLHLCRKGRTAISGSDIRAKLVRFLSVGNSSEVNPLWIAHVEKVMERSILGGVGKVGGRVLLVPGARPESAE